MGAIALANTNHWMRGGTYGWQAAEAGLFGICWTNTLANLPAWGTASPVLGNNPLVIGIPLFCLATAEALWVIFGKQDAAAASDFKLSEGLERNVVQRRTALAAAWMIGFFALIVLVGFPIAVPLLVFVYLKVQGKEGWLFTVVFTAAVWACFYGLFDLLLHLHFPEGWLVSWFV